MDGLSPNFAQTSHQLCRPIQELILKVKSSLTPLLSPKENYRPTQRQIPATSTSCIQIQYYATNCNLYQLVLVQTWNQQQQVRPTKTNRWSGLVFDDKEVAAGSQGKEPWPLFIHHLVSLIKASQAKTTNNEIKYIGTRKYRGSSKSVAATAMKMKALLEKKKFIGLVFAQIQKAFTSSRCNIKNRIRLSMSSDFTILYQCEKW